MKLNQISEHVYWLPPDETTDRPVLGVIAGKTGTAQVVGIAQDADYDPDALAEEHLDHALFIGFAPAESPVIALAVIIENGGSGGAVAAPVARTLFDEFFSLPAPPASDSLNHNALRESQLKDTAS